MSNTFVPMQSESTRTSLDESSAQYLAYEFGVSGPATANQRLDADWREQTHRINILAKKNIESRRNLYKKMFTNNRQASRSKSVPMLLQELALEWGMTWVDTASLVGVSVPALRKWRNETNEATPENHERLLSLVAFLGTLKEVLVSHPAAWMALPVEPGFMATPRDLYTLTPTAPIILLDYAACNISAETLLGEIDPDWRVHFKSEFENYLEDDGFRSLRRRENRI